MLLNDIANFRFDALTFLAKQFSFLKKVPFLAIIFDEQIKVLCFLFAPNVFYIMTCVTQQIKSWDGINTSYHQFGGLQFNLHEKEICHLHGNGLLDIKLNKKLKAAFIKQDIIEEHHMLSSGNWISIKIRSKSSIDEIISVIQAAYNSMINI